MIISVNGDVCWVCGEGKNITVHHAIPRHLNPQKNILVSVCRDCHQRINTEDIAGIYSFSIKQHKLARDLVAYSKATNNLLENYIMERLRKERKKKK